jgi:microcystin-dependent protein
MSTTNSTDAKLMLDLPMDEIRSESIVNLSTGNPKSMIPATGAPKVIYDYYMGSSVAFSGKESFQLDDVRISGAKGSSFEFWLNMDKCSDQNDIWQQLIYLKNNATNEAWGIHTRCQDQNLFLYCFNKNQTITLNKIDFDKWIHFAICIGGDDTVKTYINSLLINAAENIELNRFISGDKTFLLQIGARENKDFLHGKMAQLKFFAGIRSADEIKISMEEGRTANATFKSSYPVDFKLNSIDNGSENPVLYIENNTNGHPFRLDIINASGTAVKFFGDPVADFTLSENDYHFQLRFKKQVIATEVLENLSGANTDIVGWTFVAGKNIALLEDWISFKRSPANADEAFKGLLSITLNSMRAEAMAGARNTLVEIKYNNLYYKDSRNILSGSLTRHLDIISHLGKRNTPFDISIKGPTTILNDGKGSNDFDIVIRNITGEPVHFTAMENAGIQHSKFTLYSKEPLTFGTKPAISFAGNKFHEDQTTIEKHLPKIFNCVAQKLELKTGNDQLIIEVKNLITDHASGTLMLYLEYKNIPGFWDGVIPLALNLGRIIEKDKKIGINKSPDNTPYDLQVKGGIKSEGRISDRTGDLMPVGAIIAYGGEAAPEGWLLCDGNTIIEGVQKYEDLYKILKTQKTPNLRKMFIVGADAGNAEYKLHAQGGLAEVPLLEKHLPKHNHKGTTNKENIFNDKGYRLMDKNAYKRKLVGGIKKEGLFTSVELEYFNGYDSYHFDEPTAIETSIKEEHTHGFTTSDSGQNIAHENRPPYYALTYIIKY